MRICMEKLFVQLSQKFTGTTQKETQKMQIVFLLNAYDNVLTTYGQNNVQDNADFKKFQQLLDENVKKYTETELGECFGKLISFVNTTEPLVSKTENQNKNRARVNVVEMETVAKDFEKNWKDGLVFLHSNVTRNFAHLKTGMYILREIFKTLLVYYTKFNNLVHACFTNPPFRTSLIGEQKIMHEIKQYSKDF